MKMPGFTADASLSDSKNVGYQYANDLVTNLGQHLAPQLRLSEMYYRRRGPDGEGCFPGCVCIREEGCPCC